MVDDVATDLPARPLRVQQGDVQDLRPLLGQQLFPVPLPVWLAVMKGFPTARAEASPPPVIRRRRDIHLRQRIGDRKARSLDAAQDLQLLLCAHADVPATPYM